jgi:hypothetical protein
LGLGTFTGNGCAAAQSALAGGKVSSGFLLRTTRNNYLQRIDNVTFDPKSSIPPVNRIIR